MCHAAVACADMNGPPPGALICQATYCLGADPEAASRLQTPGLSGARLKAHVDGAISSVLPNISSLKMVVVDLSHVHPKLPKVKVYIRPVGAVVAQLLCDPSVAGSESENLDFKQALPNAMSGSAFVLNMQKHAGPGVDILCANFYHDAALVDAGRKHSLTPVSMFLAQLSPKISMPKSGSLLLG